MDSSVAYGTLAELRHVDIKGNEIILHNPWVAFETLGLHVILHRHERVP